MTDYPKRPAFFAYRFCRVMAKVCLANEIGAEACWLLTIVAQTEDAKGYREAVTYFNGQLMPLVGCKTVKALDRIRAKAIGAGWLNYQAGAKGKAGRYWVEIPARHRDWDDAPSDERPNKYVVESAGYSGSETTPEAPQKGVGIVHKSGEESSTQPPHNRHTSGQHSSLTLTQETKTREDPPRPPAEPGGGTEPASATKAAKGAGPESVPVPYSLDTAEFRAAWSKFIAHRQSMPKQKRLTPTAAELALKKLAAFGPAASVEMIERAVMNGWQGIVFPNTPPVGAVRPTTPTPGAPKPQSKRDRIIALFQKQPPEGDPCTTTPPPAPPGSPSGPPTTASPSASGTTSPA